MSNWQYFTADNLVVFRTLEDGSMESCFASVLDPSEVVDAYTPPTEPIPEVIQMKQARLALLGANLLPKVQAAFDAMESPEKDSALIEWEFSSTVERNSPWVQKLADALSLDSATLDQLFLQASKL